MQDLKRKSFLYQKENRTQSVFFPDILFTQQKKQTIQEKSNQLSRRDRQSIHKLVNSKSSLNCSEQKSFENGPTNNNPSFSARLRCDQNYLKFQKTHGLLENPFKVEQNNDKFNNSTKPVFIHVGGITSRKDSSSILQNKNPNNTYRESENREDNSEIAITPISQQKATIQFQKLLPYDKYKKQNKESGVESPNKLNHETKENQEKQEIFFNEIKKTRLKSFSLFQKGNTINVSEKPILSKKMVIKREDNEDDGEESQERLIKKNKRSFSNHLTDLKLKPIPQQCQYKINLIKQFTIKAINQRNQHLLVESNPVIFSKVQQNVTPNNLLSQSPRSSFYQTESHTFQAKVSQYIQHLQLLQSKHSQQFCTINYVNYKPQSFQEQLGKFIKCRQNSSKTERHSKNLALLNRQNQSIKSNLIQNNTSNLIYNNSQILQQTSINNPTTYEQYPFKDKKIHMDQIPLCPFNQYNNASVQTVLEQDYHDDLDLCQYVQNNAKISS